MIKKTPPMRQINAEKLRNDFQQITLELRRARKAMAQNEREWKKMEDFVAASLNETNRAKFLAYDQDLRRGIILEMIDHGVLKFVIKRAMPSE